MPHTPQRVHLEFINHLVMKPTAGGCVLPQPAVGDGGLGEWHAAGRSGGRDACAGHQGDLAQGGLPRGAASGAGVHVRALRDLRVPRQLRRQYLPHRNRYNTAQ